MAWNEKLANKVNRKPSTRPTPQLDQFDIEAEAEGRAKAAVRFNQPSIMGSRITGAKARQARTKVASSHVQNRFREEMVGHDDSSLL